MKTTLTTTSAASPGRPRNPLNKAVFTVSIAELLATMPLLRKLKKALPIYQSNEDKIAAVQERIANGGTLDNEFLTSLAAPTGFETLELESYAGKSGAVTAEVGLSEMKEYFNQLFNKFAAGVRELDPEVKAFREAEAAAAKKDEAVENEDESDDAAPVSENESDDDDAESDDDAE